MMKEIAQTGLIIIYSSLLVFHLLVLLKLIPYSIVWGGRLKTDTDMYKFESVSLVINSVFLIIVLVKANYITLDLNDIVLTVLFWAMAALFLLNTIGNLLSKNKLEKLIFTPITILLAVLTIVLALA